MKYEWEKAEKNRPGRNLKEEGFPSGRHTVRASVIMNYLSCGICLFPDDRLGRCRYLEVLRRGYLHHRHIRRRCIPTLRQSRWLARPPAEDK